MFGFLAAHSSHTMSTQIHIDIDAIYSFIKSERKSLGRNYTLTAYGIKPKRAHILSNNLLFAFENFVEGIVEFGRMVGCVIENSNWMLVLFCT